MKISSLKEKHFYTAREFYKARLSLHKLILDTEISVSIRNKLFTIEKRLQAPRSLLDDHYHLIITNEEFLKWGHIYYNTNGKKETRGKNIKYNPKEVII